MIKFLQDHVIFFLLMAHLASYPMSQVYWQAYLRYERSIWDAIQQIKRWLY